MTVQNNLFFYQNNFFYQNDFSLNHLRMTMRPVRANFFSSVFFIARLEIAVEKI